MSVYSSLYTANSTPNWVWITIYDVGKTTHMDYGWLPPNTMREWTSGNYCWGSFYHVRAEVKAGFSPYGANSFDTTVQVNPQSLVAAVAVFVDLTSYGMVETGPGSESPWSQDMNGKGNVVKLTGDGAGNYWWDHSN